MIGHQRHGRRRHVIGQIIGRGHRRRQDLDIVRHRRQFVEDDVGNVEGLVVDVVVVDVVMNAELG